MMSSKSHSGETMRDILLKEILGNILDDKFHVVVVTLVPLILLGTFVMHENYQEMLASYSSQIRNLGERSIAFRPDPLSVFAHGLTDSINRVYTIDEFGLIKVSSHPQRANPIFALFATPDLLFISTTILSLIALLFGFDAVCGEKEMGTLRMILANSVSRSAVIMGKQLGGALTFLTPYLIVVLMGLILMSLAGARLSAEEHLRLLLFVLLAAIYALCFYSLSMFISTMTASTTTSIIASLLLWAILVFIVPNIAPFIAKGFVEVPSTDLIEESRQRIWIVRAFEKIQAAGTDVNLLGGGTRERIQRDVDELEQEYGRRLDRLVDLSLAIGKLSPTMVFLDGATNIMRTGIRSNNEIIKQILDFKANPSGSPDNWRFSPTLSLRDDLSANFLWNFLILFLVNSALLSAAYVSFLRYDPR